MGSLRLRSAISESGQQSAASSQRTAAKRSFFIKLQTIFSLPSRLR